MDRMRRAAVVPDKGLALLSPEHGRSLKEGDGVVDQGAIWVLRTFLASVGFHRDSVELWEVEQEEGERNDEGYSRPRRRW
jgi:hypothetical protein